MFSILLTYIVLFQKINKTFWLFNIWSIFNNYVQQTFIVTEIHCTVTKDSMLCLLNSINLVQFSHKWKYLIYVHVCFVDFPTHSACLSRLLVLRRSVSSCLFWHAEETLYHLVPVPFWGPRWRRCSGKCVDLYVSWVFILLCKNTTSSWFTELLHIIV